MGVVTTNLTQDWVFTLENNNAEFVSVDWSLYFLLHLHFLILTQSLYTINFYSLAWFDAFILLNLIQECVQSETGAFQVLQLKYLMLSTNTWY